MVIVWLRLLLYLLILFSHELLLLLLSVTIVRSTVCSSCSWLIALGLVLLASFLTIILTLWRFIVWLTSCIVLSWLPVGLLWLCRRWGCCRASLNLFVLLIQWWLIFLRGVVQVRYGWCLAISVINFNPLGASSEVSICCLVQNLLPLASDLSVGDLWQPLSNRLNEFAQLLSLADLECTLDNIVSILISHQIFI